MVKNRENQDITEACLLAKKELNRMLKRKDVPMLTKNSIKFLIPICENTLDSNNSREVRLENTLIVLRGLISMGAISDKSRQNLNEMKSKFENEIKSIKKDVRMENITEMLESQDTEKMAAGMKDLADYAMDGFKESMMPIIFSAINSMSSENADLRRNAAKFLYYASSYRENIFIENRPEILEGLKSSDPDVRGIIALSCARAKDVESIDYLVNLQTDHSIADIGILSIPDYMIKFPHNDKKARINDIVTDCVYEIVNSKNDSTLYITKSIRKSIKGDPKVGKGLTLNIEIVPVVDLPGLNLDFTGLKGSFDIVGETSLNFDILKAGEMKLIDANIIPERSGHLKGTINCTTQNGWKASIDVEVIVENDEPQKPIREEIKKEKIENSGKKESTGSTALDTLISEIESGKTSKVVNALEELKRYVPNDKSLNDKISALAITLSLKGIEKVSKADVDSAIELVRNVKRRMDE